MRSPKVILVSMPWASNNRPSLALGILTTLAKRRGFICTALYPTFDFAVEIGADAYESLAECASFFGVSEHLFATSVFGESTLQSDRFLSPYGVGDGNPFFHLRDQIIPRFVDKVASRLAAHRPDIVGFSCTFNQVFASLAVAKALKARAPHITILIGGACVHGGMGEAYARAFPNWLDHVFTGESDDSFPVFLERWASGDVSPVDGVTYGGRLYGKGGPAAQCFYEDYIPEFNDWFSQRSGTVDDSNGTAIPFESSRGCWWGEKSHCTFCGLNNDGMSYRTKAVDRVLCELVTQAKKHSSVSFMAADNILDHRAFATLLPALTSLDLDLRLFYEIKANVSRDKVAAMASAGVRWIQPGIESFSDHVLDLMKKGVKALQNVLLLRLAQEFRITASYNILVGFPGERDDDYASMIKLISVVQHLTPPSGPATVVQVHRFSPFFNDPEKHGIQGLHACTYYNHLLPPSAGPPEAFAYFFERDIPADAPVHRWLEKLNESLGQWRTTFDSNIEKVARLGPGFVEVSTHVRGQEKKRVLSPIESAVLVVADTVTTSDLILSQFGHVSAIPEREVLDAINGLARSGMIAQIDDHLVSVVPYERSRTTAQLQKWLGSYFPALANKVDREPAIARRQGQPNRDFAMPPVYGAIT